MEVAVVGFFLLFTGVLLTAPEADRPTQLVRHWWRLLALAAMVFLAGLGLGFVSSLFGGLLILPACVATVILAGLAWPGPTSDSGHLEEGA